MATLKLELPDAKKLFPKASEEMKKIFISTFGSECFSTNIVDRVKNLDDVLAEASETDREDYLKSVRGYNSPDEMAYKKLKLIIKVINEGWQPNWNDGDEAKWFPWFAARPSGFGFSGSGCDDWFTFTDCGSRLCFSSKEKAEYVGTQFLDIYNDFLTIKSE